jgi:amidase
MIACIESGLATSYNQYLDVIRLAERCRMELDLAFQGIDALLTLSVSGEAPEGLSHTGDSTFQSLWTLLHVPAMTLPTSTGETNLPIGIQLIAPRFHDDQLLRVAEWVWTHLH